MLNLILKNDMSFSTEILNMDRVKPPKRSTKWKYAKEALECLPYLKAPKWKIPNY